MIDICLNFYVHQPYRLREFSFHEIGSSKKMDYFSEKETRKMVRLLAEKCYLPANFMLKKAFTRQEKKFKIGLAISGTALEHFEKYEPLVLSSFKELVQTGCVELLATPYHGSLSSVFSENEFSAQIQLHSQKTEELFGQKPKILFNTALIFSNQVGKLCRLLGLKGGITEGVQPILNQQNPNHVFLSRGFDNTLCLLRNQPLSNWLAHHSIEDKPEFSILKLEQLLRQEPRNTEVITLALDYHYLSELNFSQVVASLVTTIDFFKIMPGYLLNSHEYSFRLPSEAIERRPIGVYDLLEAVSWAEKTQDLSDWMSNHMQKDAVKKLYQLEKKVMASQNPSLVETWRSLQAHQHLYYMQTKMMSNHPPLSNPFQTPFDAYISFMNILSDFEQILA